MRLEDQIERLSKSLLCLDTGSLASLRRIESDDIEPLAYWRLAGENGFMDAPIVSWKPIVQIFAILTPRGERLASDRLHDVKRRLGAVLCDGGNPRWHESKDARPFLSETQFGRFLAAPSHQRSDLLTGIARRLATNRDRTSGINCTEIAASILTRDAKHNLQSIAREYYRSLDAAARKSK